MKTRSCRGKKAGTYHLAPIGVVTRWARRLRAPREGLASQQHRAWRPGYLIKHVVGFYVCATRK